MPAHPSTTLFAFCAPIVKDGDLVLPVRVPGGEIQGLSCSTRLWRAAAQSILDATTPEALLREKLTSRAMRSAATRHSRQPLLKPSGRLF